jgi:hypothetical protein
MQKGRNWVDYKEIKSTVTLEMVLNHYGVLKTLKTIPGKNALGCCPIHHGKDPYQFSVCLDRNIWRCFGSCNAGGNVFDFVSKIEGGISIRNAALLMKRLFLDAGDSPQIQAVVPTETKKDPPKPVFKEEKTDPPETEVNPPLPFTLKSLTTEHPFFAENGISLETATYFGMGFCKKGLFKDRIVIPIHDHQGRLVAYCGRSITDEQTQQEGRYKMPRGFVRSALVFNLHRLEKNETPLLVVEDFISAIKAHQNGFQKVVALMGSNIGKGQEEAILSHIGPAGRLLLLFSTSEYSRKCVDECFSLFSEQLFVKKIDITPFAETPCQLTAEQFRSLI